MKKSGLRNQTLKNIAEPLELTDCHNLIIEQPNIKGGPNNILLLSCTDITINGGTLANPVGPNDPAGHNALMDKCERVKLNGVLCTCVSPSGDGINFFESSDCEANGCKIWGPKADDDDKGAGICIDHGSHDIRIIGCDLRKFGKVGISIAYGCNLLITKTWILWPLSSAIQIDGQGYKTIIKNITITENVIKVRGDTPMVWWNKKFTQNLLWDGKKILWVKEGEALSPEP